MNNISERAQGKSKFKFPIMLIVSISTLSIIGFIVMFLVVNTIVREIIYENVVGIAERDIVIQAYEVDAWFGTYAHLVKNLATAWGAVGADSGDTGFGPDPIGVSLLEKHDTLVGVFVGFETGWHINSSRWIPPDDFDATERPWYIVGLEAGGEIGITLPYLRLLDDARVSSMSLWVPDIMGMEAVVVVDILLSAVFDKVAENELPGGGYLLMFGPCGEIIVHMNTEYMLSPEHEANNLLYIYGSEHLLHYVRYEDTVPVFTCNMLGQSYFISAPLSTINWTIAAVIPTDVVEAEVFRYLMIILAILATVLIAMTAFIVFFVSRILTREQELESLIIEQEMARERERERRRTEVAEESNKAKTRFLARMSHEIRTPINAVMGISEINLQQTDLPPNIEESFSKIHTSSNLLLGIVNDILDLSKIEAGKMETVSKEYNVASMISDISHRHLMNPDNDQVAFNVVVDKNLPAFLIGDVIRIEQVIGNFLSNAFKYTTAGSVSLSLERVDRGQSNGNIILYVSIRDTGMGMSAEQIKAIREDYSRFHEQEHQFISGTGLGMPIAYSLATLMDATIEIQSVVGKGTQVFISIPQKMSGTAILDKEKADELEQFELDARVAEKRFAFVPEPMPYGKVLVVDDIDANIYVAKGLLAFYGLNVDTCISGQEAISKVEQGRVYDVIFMDNMMPGMSGTEAMRIIRSTGYSEPIIALTASALISQEEEFIKSGFDDFLSKPIQTRHLNTMLNKYVRDKQPQEVIAAAKAAYDATMGAGIHKYQRDTDLMTKLRVDFAKSNKSTAKDIEYAFENGDDETVKHLSHTLKGLAGLINEEALGSMAGEIEGTLRLGNALEKARVSALCAELNRVLESIGDADTGNAPDIQPFDREKVISLFNEIEPMLAARSTECLSYIDELRAIPELIVLVRQMEEFEFSVAHKTLGTLRKIFNGE